jgi:hypothetical protein
MTADSFNLQNIVISTDEDKMEMRVKIEAASSGLIPEIDTLASNISKKLHSEAIANAEDTRSKIDDLLTDILSGGHKEIDAKVKEWAVMKQIPEDHSIVEYIRNYVRNAVAQNIAYSIFAHQKSGGYEN